MNLDPHTESDKLAARMNGAEHLHASLAMLSPLQRAVLHRRFWENREISEIARLTKRRWTEIDQLIESTLRELRSVLGKTEKNRLNPHAA